MTSQAEGPVGDDAFPMDAIDPRSRPWKFEPEGYLVVILVGSEEAGRVKAALVSEGFATRDMKVYTGTQILQIQKGYVRRRRLIGKVVAPFIEDVEGRELYLGYAREDRGAIWVRIREESRVARALQVLADHDYLHTRYYGARQQIDYHIS